MKSAGLRGRQIFVADADQVWNARKAFTGKRRQQNHLSQPEDFVVPPDMLEKLLIELGKNRAGAGRQVPRLSHAGDDNSLHLDVLRRGLRPTKKLQR